MSTPAVTPRLAPARHAPLFSLLLAALVILLTAPRPSQAAPTSIVYTGQLLSSTSPPTAASGSYDFQFQLFNAATGGAQVGPTVSLASVPVVDGVYQVQLSFGNVFTGQTVWLQVSYRVHPTSGSPAYTTLSPRQVAPNSAFADYATLSGSTQGLQTKAVSAAYPTTGQVLTYNGTLWAPGLVGPADLALPLTLSASSNPPLLSVTNTGSGNGVSGQSTGYGIGVSGDSSGYLGVYGHSGTVDGVYGLSDSGTGVYGYTSASGDYGFLGGAEPISGNKSPTGVFGEDTTGSGGNNGGYGVYGHSTNGTGVYGYSPSGTGVDGSGADTGVYGYSPSGTGVGGTSDGDYGDGVFGYSTGSDGRGVYGKSTGEYGTGVYGENDASQAFGVYGQSDSGYGVYGVGNVYAGYFQGDVTVTGTLTSGTKDFKIDHPLDPAHKYLYHASVESDKMENVYNGHVTTDAQGTATVTLPGWFQSLNGDFEYQLTVLGQFAQAVVSQEIQDNRFTIKTDHPNVKVSWQVTGVRHDAFALAHPLQVEQDKPEGEQGLYQNPEAFGLTAERGIGYARRQSHARPAAPVRP